MVDPEVRSVVLEFVRVLRSKGVRVHKAILYGSHASGKAHSDSDVDVAIVSPDFGKDRVEEGTMLFRAAWRVDPRIEPVPIPAESYEKDTWLPLVHEIRTNGLEIDAA